MAKPKSKKSIAVIAARRALVARMKAITVERDQLRAIADECNVLAIADECNVLADSCNEALVSLKNAIDALKGV